MHTPTNRPLCSVPVIVDDSCVFSDGFPDDFSDDFSDDLTFEIYFKSDVLRLPQLANSVRSSIASD